MFEMLRDMGMPCRPQDLALAIYRCGFDPDIYKKSTGDLEGFSLDQATYHFLLQGFRENRNFPLGRHPMQGIEKMLALKIENEGYKRLLTAGTMVRQFQTAAQSNLTELISLIKVLKLYGYKPYVVIGDSHSELYSRFIDDSGDIYVPVNLICSGATALGLGREGTRSGVGLRVIEWVADLKANVPDLPPIFLKFGQVDVEFTSTFKRMDSTTPLFSLSGFVEFSMNSIASYKKFIGKAGFAAGSFMICSIFPPTLTDAAWKEGYVNANIAFSETGEAIEEIAERVKRLEIPSMRFRTEMHSLYNHMLRAMAEEVGGEYVDDFTPLVGSSGIVATEFTPGHPGNDHHLGHDFISPVIAPLVLDSIKRNVIGHFE